MLKLPVVVDRVDNYLNLDGQLFKIHSSSVITFLPKKRFGPSKNIKPLLLRAKDLEIVQEKTEKSAEDVRHLYDSFKNQFPKEKIFKK